MFCRGSDRQTLLGREIGRCEGDMNEQESASVASDAELVAEIRTGDRQAIAELFARHNTDAVRVGRIINPEGDAEELVTEAFARVLNQIIDGKGPTEHFRAYLHTVIRNLNIERIRHTRLEQPASDKLWLLDAAEADEEEVDQVDTDRAARALRSLPQNWQDLLWKLEVQGRRPAEVAAELAIPVATVSDTAYRARKGLRLAYLNQHLPPANNPRCVWTRDRLGRYVRDGLSARASTKLRHHLDACVECAALHGQLSQLNQRLGATIWPIVLVGGSSLGGISLNEIAGAGLAGGVLGSSTNSVGAGASGAGLASATPLTVIVAGLVTTVITAVAATGLWLQRDDPQVRRPDSAPTPVRPLPPEDPPAESVDDSSLAIENFAMHLPLPAATPQAEQTSDQPPPEIGRPRPKPDDSSGPQPGPGLDPDPAPGPDPDPETPGEPVADPDPVDLKIDTPKATATYWPHHWLLTVPLLAVEGSNATSFTINLELSTSEPTGFITRISSGWDCGPIEDGDSNGDPYFFGEEVPVTCKYSYRPGQAVAPLQLILESINPPSGTITISGDSNADPGTSDDHRQF